MAKIEKASLDMYQDVCALLLDGRTGPEAEQQADRFYQPIFNYAWERDEQHVGHVLVHQGEIVGFVGSFFVQRCINDTMHRFANLTTWKVKDEFRSESIFLLMQFLKQKDLIVTGRTAAKEIFAIQQKLGFKDLDSTMTIVPTFLGLSGGQRGIAVSDESRDLENGLRENDLRLYLDHRPYKCRHLLVKGNNRYCYLVFSPVKKRHVPVAHLHYISDLEVFIECLPQIKAALLFRHALPFIWIEDRFLRGRTIKPAFKYNSRFTHLVRSTSLAREEIDNLYTELVIFNTLENRFF